MSVLAAEGQAARIWRGMRSSPKAMVALTVCLILIVSAIFAPWIAPQNPYDLG